VEYQAPSQEWSAWLPTLKLGLPPLGLQKVQRQQRVLRVRLLPALRELGLELTALKQPVPLRPEPPPLQPQALLLQAWPARPSAHPPLALRSGTHP
jgi:hypothetical protein